MANFNQVILMGRLTADPELKQTQSGASVCNFTIAINRRTSRNDQEQQAADFITVVAWRQTAEIVAKYFKKGRAILVSGQIQTRSYTDKQGAKRTTTEVVASQVEFVDSKSDIGAESASAHAPKDDEVTAFTEIQPSSAPDLDLPF